MNKPGLFLLVAIRQTAEKWRGGNTMWMDCAGVEKFLDDGKVREF
jgi:hypothetical protein